MEVKNLKTVEFKSSSFEILHKCFLYDNDQKILDSSNFQVSWFIVQVFPFLLLACFCKSQKKKVHGCDLSCSVTILCSYDINTICLQPMQFFPVISLYFNIFLVFAGSFETYCLPVCCGTTRIY